MPRFTLLCLAVLTLAANVRADNWERFRGPNGNGISTDKTIPLKFSATENVRWKTKLDGTGNSSPIISGDRIFIHLASADATQRSLVCFDAKDGKELWRRSIPGTKVKFRFDSSHASATPAADGQAVYVPFWNGKDVILTAYDFKGEKLWDRNLGEFVSQHGAGASPIVYKNLVIFSIDKDAFRDTTKKTGPVANPSTLYAFDKKTGKTVWEAPREAIRACYTAPFLLEKPGQAPELIVTSSTAITSYEPETGKSKWYFTWTWANDPLRTIAGTSYINGTLVACSGDGSGERQMVGVALKGTGKDIRPEQAWNALKAKESPYVPAPIVQGNHLYFVNDLGMAGCLEGKSGKRLYYERLTTAKIYASPIMIDGKIYAACENGDVNVYAAEPSFKVLAQNSIGESIMATPAVANGALYIRTVGHLVCIGK